MKTLNIFLLAISLIISPLSYADKYDQLVEDLRELISDSGKLEEHHEKALAEALADGKKYPSSVSKQQAEILSSYTIDSEQFNTALKDGFDISHKDNALAKSLMESMKKLPPKNRITYRGAGFSTDFFSGSVKKGDYLKTSIFTSSSYSASVADEFANVNGQEGHKFMYVIESTSGANISPFSKVHSTEAEVLFTPDTTFEVKSIKADGETTFVALKETKYVKKGAAVKNLYDGQPLSCGVK